MASKGTALAPFLEEAARHLPISFSPTLLSLTKAAGLLWPALLRFPCSCTQDKCRWNDSSSQLSICCTLELPRRKGPHLPRGGAFPLLPVTSMGGGRPHERALHIQSLHQLRAHVEILVRSRCRDSALHVNRHARQLSVQRHRPSSDPRCSSALGADTALCM